MQFFRYDIMLILVLLFGSIVILAAESKSSYVILAPAVLRPGKSYHVGLWIKEIFEPVDVRTFIQKDGLNWIEKNTTLQSGKASKIRFDIPEDAPPDNYKLIIFGNTPSWSFMFYNFTELKYMNKSKSIFIQLDKPVYRAGDTVHMRVVVVKTNLKPYSGLVNVYIEDGKGNRIKEWNNSSSPNGVIRHYLHLSKYPILGSWKIIVLVEKSKKIKYFDVEEFKIPRFDVSLNLPSFALLSDKNIPVTVISKYSYGQGVKGVVEVMAIAKGYNSILIKQYSKLFNGEAKIAFPLGELTSRMNYFWIDKVDFLVTATIVEATTNISRNTSSVLIVYKKKVKIDIIKSSSSFKPGLSYAVYIKLSFQDGKLLPNPKHEVTVTYGANYGENLWNSSILIIGANGVGKFVIETNSGDNILHIKVDYGDVSKSETVYPMTSPSKTFIKLSSLSDNIKVGEIAAFELSSTVSLPSYSYVVLSRGCIISFVHANLKNEFITKIHLPITVNMAPSSRIIVFTIRDNYEVVADALDVNIDGFMQNNVNITLQPLTGKDYANPSDDIKVRVEAAPNSYIGIMALDQNTLIRQTGNGIKKCDIFGEIDTYNYGIYGPSMIDHDVDNLPRKWHWGIWGLDAFEIFKNSGVNILTNANIDFGNHRYYYENIHPMVPGSKGIGYSSELARQKSKQLHAKAGQGGNIYPETWLWLDANASSFGLFEKTVKVPETITSWVASAFAMENNIGLGVSSLSPVLRVFKPFFVSLNLPNSVIRGEILHVQVLVFNYLPQKMKASVVLEGNTKFMFANEKDTITKTIQKAVKSIEVESNDVITVSFPISPVALGDIELKVTAHSELASDTEVRSLVVEAEGIQKFESRTLFVDLNFQKQFQNAVKIILPPTDVADGSQNAQVSVSGDILGLSLNHLNHLLLMPTGCGEQNMVNFVPNVLVAMYLNETDRWTPVMQERATINMELGYQRELTYRRTDNSFSAFGNKDKNGSTWLTAFVIKSFVQARKFIPIDKVVLWKAMDWLLKVQRPDGSFPEVGIVINNNLRGQPGSDITLTAYVLIALIRSQNEEPFTEGKMATILEKSIQNATNYLEGNVDNVKETADLCLIAYALVLAKSSKATEVSNKMLSLSVLAGGGIYKFWAKDVSVIQQGNKGKPIDIEMTAYALLVLSYKKDVTGSLPIIRWLTSQMNQLGGFKSTQDTMIAIEALTSIDKQTHSTNLNMNILLEANFGNSPFTHNFRLNSDNALFLQIVALPRLYEEIELSATGTGTAIIQVSWQYNIEKVEEDGPFSIHLNIARATNGFHLKACTMYKEKDRTGMVVMEIKLPSGYMADEPALATLILVNPQVQRFEAISEGSEIIIYFNQVNSNVTCVDVHGYQIFQVGKFKSVPVTVYQYYKPERRSVKLYQPPLEITAVVTT